MKRAKNSPLVSKRVPVLVYAATYARFQAYCNTTGSTATHAVNEALNCWMDSVGAVRLEAFKRPGREILAADFQSRIKSSGI